jgi:hypothetical protein
MWRAHWVPAKRHFLSAAPAPHAPKGTYPRMSLDVSEQQYTSYTGLDAIRKPRRLLPGCTAPLTLVKQLLDVIQRIGVHDEFVCLVGDEELRRAITVDGSSQCSRCRGGRSGQVFRVPPRGHWGGVDFGFWFRDRHWWRTLIGLNHGLVYYSDGCSGGRQARMVQVGCSEEYGGCWERRRNAHVCVPKSG